MLVLLLHFGLNAFGELQSHFIITKMQKDIAKRVAQDLKKAIKNKEGNVVSLFFDVGHLKTNRDACATIIDQNITQILGGHDIWMESFSYLLQVPLAATDVEGFELYNRASAPIIRNFKELPSNLSIPCMRTIAQSLRYYATHADYAESANQMQKILRPIIDAKITTDESPLLYVVNELISIYYLRNNFKQAENLLKHLFDLESKNKVNFKQFKNSEKVCFYYNCGRISAIFGHLKDAKEKLQLALELCPISQKENRTLIYLYYIPVEICCGNLPTQPFLIRYGLQIYQKLLYAVMNGDIKLFDEELDSLQLELIKLGLFELMIRVRSIAFLQLLKVVHAACNYESLLDLSIFHAALLKHHEYSLAEAESIVANLIEHKMVKAYIHHGLKKIVLAKDKTFPQIELSDDS